MTLNRSSDAFTVALSMLFALLMIWPMFGTIALRNILLGGLLLISLWLVSVGHEPWRNQLPKVPALLLTGLTAWLVLVIVGWAADPTQAWKELLGQWVVPYLCAFVGTVLGITALNHGKALVVIRIVFAVLLIQVVAHDLLNLWFYATQGQLAFRAAPVLRLAEAAQVAFTGGTPINLFEPGLMDKFSYVNNTLAAFLIAEIAQRLIRKSRCLPYGNGLIAFATIAMLFCSYTVQTRNGNVGLLMLIATAGLLVCLKSFARIGWTKLILGLGVVAVLLALLGGMFYKSDPRWQTLRETLPIAWDTQTHKAWMTHEDFPLLPNGAQVDVSNYERLAWAKEGAILMQEHPLGIGYSRTAFGDQIDRKYGLGGVFRGSHSHSGLIDFGIANGFPGLVLWLVFLASLAWTGWRAFEGEQMALGLMLIFLVSGFFGRSIVDSNLRDHMLQQFLMIVAILTVFVQQRSRML